MAHHHLVKLVIATSIIFAASQSGYADPPAHARNGKKGAVHVEANHRADQNHSIAVANCPPGLAKKSPACVPPGQAKKAYNVGDRINWDQIHIITQPGRYGLSTPPRGDRYAVVNGRLVRVNEESGQILSILRVIEAILD